MYRLYRFADKLKIQNGVNSKGNCVLDSGNTLNVENCINQTESCVQYIYRLSGFAEIEYPVLRKLIRKFCTLYAQIVQICRESEFHRYVECTKLRKSNGKLCTL